MRGPRPGALLAAYAVLALAPLGIATLSGPRESDLLRELASGAGLVALAMLLLQFISSGRFETLSGRARIDQTMRFHQLAARALAALVVLHPLLFLLPTKWAAVGATPAALTTMFLAPHLMSGVGALLLLLALVSLSVWRRRVPVRYETFRATHAVAAVGVAGLAGHHAVSVGAYTAEPAMLALWVGLLGLALGSIAFVYAVKPWLLLRRAYRVKSNDEVGRGIRELVLEPAGSRGIRFEAGQFAWVNFTRFPLPVFDHPFSISSSPSELPQVRFLIKARGDFTGRIREIPVGTRAFLDAPHGAFTLGDHDADAIALFAGGIGIAPVMSVLRQLRATRDRRPISLVYGARDTQQLVHAREIEAMTEVMDLRVAFSLDEPPPGWSGRTGEIEGQAVHDAVREVQPARCLCLVCGPTGMMLVVERLLLALGIPPRMIVYERFDYE